MITARTILSTSNQRESRILCVVIRVETAADEPRKRAAGGGCGWLIGMLAGNILIQKEFILRSASGSIRILFLFICLIWYLKWLLYNR